MTSSSRVRFLDICLVLGSSNGAVTATFHVQVALKFRDKKAV